VSDDTPSEQWLPSAAGTPGNFPWWLLDPLDDGQGTVLVRCFAALTAVLADELGLPVGALPQLLRAALDDYARPDGPVGPEPFMTSLYAAVRTALG
jgi:hypothetical protein